MKILTVSLAVQMLTSALTLLISEMYSVWVEWSHWAVNWDCHLHVYKLCHVSVMILKAGVKIWL